MKIKRTAFVKRRDHKAIELIPKAISKNHSQYTCIHYFKGWDSRRPKGSTHIPIIPNLNVLQSLMVLRVSQRLSDL